MWYPGAVKLFFYLPWAAFLAMAGTAFSQQEGPDAISRIFRHNNGQKTYTQKMGGSKEITESVFDKNDILCGVRVFNLDDRGRISSGIIYDGKKNIMGCTRNFFDPQTGQMLQEKLYDKLGRNVRVLYYPGARFTFTGPQTGTFTRQTYTEGIFRDQDSGTFCLSCPP